MTTVVDDLRAETGLITALRDKSVPNHRRAYSDRTAWLMACVSELAYLRFNALFGREAQRAVFQKAVDEVLTQPSARKLHGLIDAVSYDPAAEREQLQQGLGCLSLNLEATFDHQGTQAIVVSGVSGVTLRLMRRGVATSAPGATSA